MAGFTAPVNYFGVFVPQGEPPEVIATLDHLWATTIADSDVLRKLCRQPWRAVHPTLRQSGAGGGVPGRAGECLDAVSHGSGEDLARHRGHPRTMTRGAGRPNRHDGLGWAALGVVIVVLSARMDRLAEQDVPAFAVPGLLPGLLGLLMVLSGALLALRRTAPATAPAGRTQGLRLAITLALCLAFSLGLIGHGLPFWLAASLFVTVSVLVLQAPQHRAAGRGFGARAVVVAAAIGLGAGTLATFVFQSIFLVQLP